MKKMMMMLVMVTIALTASAQNTLREEGTFTVQPKIGIGLGMLSGDWVDMEGVDKKMRVGFVAGVEGEYYANDWLGIAAGVCYNQQGWKLKDEQTSTTSLDYLNVPVTGNFYVVPGLALKTGVQLGYLVNAKIGSVESRSDCEKLSVSIPVGISYEINDFVVDLRYNIPLRRVNKYGDDVKARSSFVQMTLGYKIPLM